MKFNPRPLGLIGGSVLLVGLVWVFCSRPGTQEVPVAQVGGERLFREDVEREVPRNLSKSITLDEKKNYTRRWVNTELLYLEARRRGLDKLPEIQRELKRVKRSLLANKLLEQTFPEKPVVSDSAVQAYYQANRGSFIRNRDEIHLVYLIFTSQKKATFAVAALKRGQKPKEVASDSSLRPVEMKDTGLIPRDQIPAVFAKKIRKVKKGRTVGPLKTAGGFVVIHVLDVQPAGSQRTLDEVRPKIEALLQQEKERDLYHRLLNELKRKQKVVVNLKALESASVDSSHRERKGKGFEK